MSIISSAVHDIFVMFDNYDSISEIDELPKIVYEKPAVSRMETNRRLIKYIGNTLQSCTYLCGPAVFAETLHLRACLIDEQGSYTPNQLLLKLETIADVFEDIARYFWVFCR